MTDPSPVSEPIRATTTTVRVVVDGVGDELAIAADTSLLRALRDAGHLTVMGACEEGECGSCTVRLDDRFVCACLVPAAACADSEVATARSLLSDDLAESLVAHGAVQCGFCTPGFVVSAAAALDGSTALLTADDVREQLAGNLCRCTGYAALIAAVLETDRRRKAGR